MLKKLICLSCLSLSLFAEQTIPATVDFSDLFPTSDYEYKSDGWSLGQLAFNSAPEVGTFVAYLKKTYGIKTAVETGTYKGNTSVLLSILFDQVHTIEISEETYNQTKERLAPYSHVHCHLGTSEKVLKKLLPSLKDQPLLFYLDAHWYDNWPLRDELIEISKTHKDNCILIIDDFKVPGRKDVLYDKYKEHECSYEYIQNQLKEVFTDCSIHYVIPKNPNCKGKLVALHKKWETNQSTHQSD